MKLTTFRIQKYKCIRDSGWININNLVALVGKNESGKSSLLQALYKFNPHGNLPNSYSLDYDWPRAEFPTKDAELPVCSCTFSLEEDEIRELSQKFNHPLPEAVEVSRLYNGEYSIPICGGLPPVVRPGILQEEIKQLPSTALLGGPFKEAAEETLARINDKVSKGNIAELPGVAATIPEQLKPTQGQDFAATQNELRFISDLISKVEDLTSRLSRLPNMSIELKQDLLARMPAFIYMSDYTVFNGTANLNDVNTRKENGTLTQADQTFLILIEVAGLDPVRLASPVSVDLQDFELKEASKRITDRIRKNNRQRLYTVDFRLNGNQFMTRIDEDNRAIIYLHERSRGFQWFFSFDLLLMHGRKGFGNCVLLLDEPGIHLHPEGQRDLLHLLKNHARLNTVIYTTHLPFMLDLRRPETILIQDQLRDSGIAQTRSAENYRIQNTRSALRAALGIRGSDSLLLTERNLIVEGADDYWIISGLSDLLVRSGERGLPDDVRIFPAGGAPPAVDLTVFMLEQGLEVVTLFDGDGEGRQSANNLQNKWFKGFFNPAKLEIVTLSELIGEERLMTIEDLFPDEYYFEAAKEAYPAVTSLPEALPSNGDLLADRVKKIFMKATHGKFEKSQISRVLKNRLVKAKHISELPPLSQAYARTVIAGLDQCFTGRIRPTLIMQKAASIH